MFLNKSSAPRFSFGIRHSPCAETKWGTSWHGLIAMTHGQCSPIISQPPTAGHKKESHKLFRSSEKLQKLQCMNFILFMKTISPIQLKATVDAIRAKASFILESYTALIERSKRIHLSQIPGPTARASIVSYKWVFFRLSTRPNTLMPVLSCCSATIFECSCFARRTLHISVSLSHLRSSVRWWCTIVEINTSQSYLLLG